MSLIWKWDGVIPERPSAPRGRRPAVRHEQRRSSQAGRNGATRRRGRRIFPRYARDVCPARGRLFTSFTPSSRRMPGRCGILRESDINIMSAAFGTPLIRWWTQLCDLMILQMFDNIQGQPIVNILVHECRLRKLGSQIQHGQAYFFII